MELTGRDDQIDGPNGVIPIRRYTPSLTHHTTDSPTVVWLHGGGFFSGGLNQPEAHGVAVALARRGHPIVTVDYRLVPIPFVGKLNALRRIPSNRHPVPVDDVLTVLRHVTELVPGAVVLGGASAGACLAAGTALRYGHDGDRLAGVLLAYGFFHFSHPEAIERHHRPRGHRRLTHSRWALNAMNRNYLAQAPDATDPYAFPGGANLQGFPPSLLLNAERDGMRASAELFAAELVTAGSQVERHLLRGSRHAFLNNPNSAHFATGIELMASWLDAIGNKPWPKPDRGNVR